MIVAAALLVGSSGVESKATSKASSCQTDPKLRTFEQAFDTSLGDKAVNSGVKGSIDKPPFLGTVDKSGNYQIVASLFETTQYGITANELDSSDHPDPYAKIDIVGFTSVQQPDGTWLYQDNDCE